MTDDIKPFEIKVTDQVIEDPVSYTHLTLPTSDLHYRLAQTRWPDEVGDNWQYGTDLNYLKSLCEYWLKQYNWREQEAKMNRLDHFKTQVNGRELHFIHQRSPHADAMPLVMTHGWPGSIAEFMDIIPILTEPERYGGKIEDAFHLICPSIPGFGFSQAPDAPGFDLKNVAEGHLNLMAQLGYTRFGVQGGDMGSPVSSWTAVLAPERVIGLHLTLVFAGVPKDKSDPLDGVSEEEKRILAERREHMKDGIGYQAIQGTKPQTLGYGLNDSPTGLAAWITEKFHGWTHCHGDLDSSVSKDELLTNIMVYWITQTITSSARYYYESNHSKNNMFESGKIRVPTGCTMFPGELYQPPRAWVEELYEVIHWTRQPEGGHFAAMEKPGLLAADLQNFFRELR